MLKKVISGGQTGVDRAALDAALGLRIPLTGHVGLGIGGWCPKGRRAEDGPIPDRYPLQEALDTCYKKRTWMNVRDSDGTLIVTSATPTGGTAFTIQCAIDLKKPYLLLDASTASFSAQEHTFQAWLEGGDIQILNVAGPRESKCPGIYQAARALLERLLPEAVKKRA